MNEDGKPKVVVKMARPEVMEEIYAELDQEIAWIVMLLRDNGINTFTSCQGGEGHSFSAPTIRIIPTDVNFMQPDVDRIARVLSGAYIGGYYLKQCYSYQSGPQPWGRADQHFIEIEFWLVPPSAEIAAEMEAGDHE